MPWEWEWEWEAGPGLPGSSPAVEPAGGLLAGRRCADPGGRKQAAGDCRMQRRLERHLHPTATPRPGFSGGSSSSTNRALWGAALCATHCFRGEAGTPAHTHTQASEEQRLEGSPGMHAPLLLSGVKQGLPHLARSIRGAASRRQPRVHSSPLFSG